MMIDVALQLGDTMAPELSQRGGLEVPPICGSDERNPRRRMNHYSVADPELRCRYGFAPKSFRARFTHLELGP
jgi:hypothetical protein